MRPAASSSLAAKTKSGCGARRRCSPTRASPTSRASRSPRGSPTCRRRRRRSCRRCASGLADMGSTDDGGFGTTETGPDQGGWGVPYGRPSIRSGELDPPVSIELKGVDVDGEVALIDSHNYLASGCAKATDNEYVQGDWADPPGVVANPIFRPKFWFKVVVHHTNILDGPVANFTIRPPPELTGPQIRQRNRNDWPQPSPLPRRPLHALLQACRRLGAAHRQVLAAAWSPVPHRPAGARRPRRSDARRRALAVARLPAGALEHHDHVEQPWAAAAGLHLYIRVAIALQRASNCPTCTSSPHSATSTRSRRSTARA